ncbi:MAG: bifunctional lysylphosphatidylglycerol flippase/synthetase MprF [Spirochaetota bacterium]
MDKDQILSTLKRLAPFGIGAVLAFALWLLYGELRHYNIHEITKAVSGYSGWALAAAAGATALNYVVLTLFDTMGIRYAGASLSWPKTAFTSFLSYVFSYNVGLSIFGASAVRYRFYSAWGLAPAQIAKVIGFCVFSFWVGLFSMGAITFILAPPAPVAGLPAFFAWGRGIGIALAATIVLYFVFSLFGFKGLSFRGFEIQLPRPPLVIGQILSGSLDWLCAGLALYAVLPASGLGFFHFLAIYMMAQIAGVTSHVPGGLGVFETVIVPSLSSVIPGDRLFASLLVYRLIYYLAPLALALISFLAAELLRERGRLASGAQVIARFILPSIPTLIAAGTFIAGAFLLLSVSYPTHKDRIDFISLVLPLGVMEFSHFAASLTGLGLLVLAEALHRRINAAWFLSCVLLALGALFSLLRGFRYEEALFLLVMLAFLVPLRGLFHRRAAVLTRDRGLGWAIALVVVVISAGWLGFFSWKHVEYSSDLWWQFEFQAGAPRFLRAALGVSLLGLVIFARELLLPEVRKVGEGLAGNEAAVKACIAANDAASANLALLGDKFFSFAPDKGAFIMYGVSGRSCIAMGDPVGDPELYSDLLWRFCEEQAKNGTRVVFYEISNRHLPVYIELGMTLMKTGEEARVPLSDFSLEGGRRAKLRTPFNKMRREGYSFRVIDSGKLDAVITDLKRISTAWLEDKKGKEKGFSLGRFNEAYLANFPCAVIEKDGAIHAFADVWATGPGGELAIDLMRHDPKAPNGIMEFLFTNLMLWGREGGYSWFNLGIAPMSGVKSSEAGPIWNKAISLIYNAGGSLYNFEGLRRYKEKYDPQWSPVYLASRGRLALPIIAAEITALVARGESKT